MWGVGRRMQCIDLTLGTSPKKKKFSSTITIHQHSFCWNVGAFCFAVEKLSWMCTRYKCICGKGGKKTGKIRTVYSTATPTTLLQVSTKKNYPPFSPKYVGCCCAVDLMLCYCYTFRFGYRHTAIIHALEVWSSLLFLQWYSSSFSSSSSTSIQHQGKNFLEIAYRNGCSESWHKSKFHNHTKVTFKIQNLPEVSMEPEFVQF